MRSYLIAASIGLIPLALPAVSAASPGENPVVVSPVEYEGKVKEAARMRVDEELRSALERSGLPLAEAGSEESSGYRVRTRVRAVSRDYEIVIDLVSAEGEVIATTEETCEICGLDELAGAITTRAGVIAKEIETLETLPPPKVVVQSTPTGATVIVDGEPVGETPMTVELTAGDHHIRLEKDGHVAMDRQISLADGVNTKVDLDLPIASEKSGKLRPLGWAALGTGAAFVGGGIALLAIDAEQNTKRCDGQDVDIDGDCRFVFNTKWAGAAVGATGAAIAATGAAILIFTRARKGKRQERVQATFGPTSVGLSGRF